MINLATALKSTYKTKKESEKTFNDYGYAFDKQLSNQSDRVYFNPYDNKLLITYRGTTNLINDIPADLSILTGKYDAKRFTNAQKQYEAVKQKYYKTDDITLAGHSLGGSIASRVGHTDPNSKVITYNKGSGSLFEKKKDNETHYREKGDLISILNSSNSQTLGNSYKNPLTAHNTDNLIDQRIEI
jgi:hypothetical protein